MQNLTTRAFIFKGCYPLLQKKNSRVDVMNSPFLFDAQVYLCPHRFISLNMYFGKFKIDFVQQNLV